MDGRISLLIVSLYAAGTVVLLHKNFVGSSQPTFKY